MKGEEVGVFPPLELLFHLKSTVSTVLNRDNVLKIYFIDFTFDSCGLSSRLHYETLTLEKHKLEHENTNIPRVHFHMGNHIIQFLWTLIHSRLVAQCSTVWLRCQRQA